MTEPLSPEEIEELQKLRAQATPGRWHKYQTGIGEFICGVAPGRGNAVYADTPGGTRPSADLSLIVAAHSALPRLLDIAEDHARLCERAETPDLARELEQMQCDCDRRNGDHGDHWASCNWIVRGPAILAWAERRLAEQLADHQRIESEQFEMWVAKYEAARADSELLAKVEKLLHDDAGLRIDTCAGGVLVKRSAPFGMLVYSKVFAPTLREALRELVGEESTEPEPQDDFEPYNRCWAGRFGVTNTLAGCGKPGRWHNPNAQTAFARACRWCDEHKHDDDVLVESPS